MRTSLAALGLIIPVAVALAQKPATPSGNAGETQSKGSTASATSDQKSGSTEQVKTQIFKGTLVDASCAGGSNRSSAATSSTSSADRSGQSSSTHSNANKSGEANRTADNGATGQSCSASSNTTEFGLQTRDGHVLRFDSVGNERAKEAMTAKKNWANASSAGKPIHATVSGTESDDKLTVVSIH